MANKFNPDDLKNPLYEYSQVITIYDLRVIYANLVHQYKHTSWWEIRMKFGYIVAINAIKELINWLVIGKPTLKK